MNQDDKKIQELLKGNFSTEEPSFDFTNLVMEKVAKIEVELEKPFVYTPVISKLGWGIILAVLVGIVFTIIVLGSPSESVLNIVPYIPKLNLDFSLFQSPVVALSLGSILLLLFGERAVQRGKS